MPSVQRVRIRSVDGESSCIFGFTVTLFSLSFAPRWSHFTMMRLALSLFAVLAVFVIETNSQSCAAETAALQASPTIAQATVQLQQSILEQLQTCESNGATDCPVDVSSEKENVVSACEIAGGIAYLPTVDWSCDNSEAKTTTTLEVNYAACLGANCSETEITETWDSVLNNVTATANLVLGNAGITCEVSVSGATAMFLQSSVAVLIVMGSAMAMLA